MASSKQQYSVELEISQFFEKTSATRSECDASAKELVGGDVDIIAIQGSCSYTVYAGPSQEFVVQFRPKSVSLKLETVSLAREIHGALVPEASFKGQLGKETDADGKEPLCIYVMPRIRGVTYLDFLLSRKVSENAPEWFAWRNSLITDLARFFAHSWKHPQDVGPAHIDRLRHKCESELKLLLGSLPDRFQPFIQRSLDAIPAVFSLPIVLLHEGFDSCDIMVDDSSCHLVGMTDWGLAEFALFGLSLVSLEQFMSKFHLKNGRIRYDDYEKLQETFWSVFRREAGSLSDDVVRAIRSARIVGLLLTFGFTPRLANMPEPVPIRDDERGAYNILHLDGLLINPATRITTVS